jgi:hypothetical protein
MEIWIFYGHLTYFIDIFNVYFVVIGYIFPKFGILHQVKSGNPSNVVFCRKGIKIVESLQGFGCDRVSALKNVSSPLEQGCQIFLDKIYQNGEKYTK